MFSNHRVPLAIKQPASWLMIGFLMSCSSESQQQLPDSSNRDLSVDVQAQQSFDVQAQLVDSGTIQQPDTGTVGGPDIGPITSCSAINATVCFSNLDCPTEQRCQNLGTAEDQVPCCVVGARGKKKGGEECNEVGGQLECESGICINKDGPFYCSKDCTTVDDCPTGMKQCIPISAPPNQYKWCFPEE